MGRWLVTGATGLLGANLLRILGASAIGTARRLPRVLTSSGIRRDLSSAAGRSELVALSGADCVIHCAAVSTIEACENSPELAWELNVNAAADLARQAADLGVGFIHISTDAVFDGRTGGYTEQSTPNPQTVYAKTKLAGESAVLSAHPNAMVARVNFYGWSPSGNRGLAEFFFNNLRSGQTVPGFNDQIVSTLEVSFLAGALTALYELGASGILNVASSEPITKYQFGRNLAKTFGFNPELVVESQQSSYLHYPRSPMLNLDTTLIQNLLGQSMPNQLEGFQQLAAERSDGVPEFLQSFY